MITKIIIAILAIAIICLLVKIYNLKEELHSEKSLLINARTFKNYSTQLSQLMWKSKAEYIDDGMDGHDSNWRISDSIILRYNTQYFTGFYLNNKEVSLRVVIRKLIKHNLI
ncbi:MAG: hypothetical protein ACXAC7_23545 [Candidatus Hodarchaeales archaeon]|jgi:hypothetical protein